ncbi:MAG: ribonuclease HII [Candidatus Altiarchaeota archaeon]|nr:ribonuclease HII [Candidatus Altiarchaeota archaeon]
MNKLFCGIDEAGRGPVIGPMVLCCVVVDKKGIEKLSKLRVRDSKKVAPGRREHLEPLIKSIVQEWVIAKVTPRQIDSLRKEMSLNAIEAVKTAELILSLKNKPSKITIDATDNIADDYTKRIVGYMTKMSPDYRIPAIVSEHKADANYIEVGAASIIAKVERDREIEELKKEYGNFGSGYPSDELTQKFLKKLVKEGGGLPDYVRKSWNTVRKSKQFTLGDF